MENNQELFRQAILNAKTVRETSLAAARNSLAEHFEPQVKEMFNQAIAESDMEENADMEEVKHHKHGMEESYLDEILSELDALSEDMEEEGADKMEEAKVTTTAGYPEKAHTAKGDKNGSYSEKAKATKGNDNGSYSEKAKSSIHEGEDEEAEEDDDAEEAGHDLTHDMEHDDDTESVEGSDEQEVVDITVGELKDIIRDVFAQLHGGAGEQAPEGPLDADTDLAADLGDEAPESEEDEKEISLEEILAELEAEESKMEEAALVPGNEIDPKAGDVYKVEEMRKDLNEAIKTIKVLKTELNEMNLFNAKMLYVNKIFKAKNLNEAQKTKVINAFDRATSVKEVENTYKTILESVSVETKKSSLKESVGFASKPIGVAQARPIVEADAFVSRWQQLAGIK